MMKYYTSVLTKKTYTQSPQHESENSGCMPGLFRLFDLRKNQKLISNRNYNINHPIPVEVESNEKPKFNGDLFENVNKGAPVQSIKTLMEEEMEKLIPCDKIQNQISKKDEKIERNNSILMIPPSPESFNFTNPVENSDLESNLSSKEVYFKLHEASNYYDNNHDYYNHDNNDNNSEGYSRIVILKPSLSRITSPIHSDSFSERNFHQFSIREIKRRLKQTITENKTEHDSISVFSTGEDERNSTGEERLEIKTKSFSYEEAKRHLMERVESMEMKSRFEETGTGRPVLSRLISFPDFDLMESPICTPKKEDDDLDFLGGNILKFSEKEDGDDNLDFSDGNILKFSKKEGDGDDLELLSENILKFTEKEEDGDDLGLSDGNILKFNEKEDHDDLEFSDENILKFECLEPLQEGVEVLDLCEEIKEEGNDYLDESLDLLEEGSQNETESSYLYEEEEMSPNYSEILEENKSSPIFGDVTKSPSRIAKYEEMPIQRTIIKFREPEIFDSLKPNPNYSTILNNVQTRCEFISAVLKASGFCNSKFFKIWIEETESPFLDPFIYDEIGVCYDYTEESKILFELIEEALFEIKNKYFIFAPRMNFPLGETLILEVCKWVEGYLTHRFPCTLDQIVKRDLDLGFNWRDFRSDLEIIVLDLGEELLDDLLEEIVFDLWL